MNAPSISRAHARGGRPNSAPRIGRPTRRLPDCPDVNGAWGFRRLKEALVAWDERWRSDVSPRLPPRTSDPSSSGTSTPELPAHSPPLGTRSCHAACSPRSGRPWPFSGRSSEEAEATPRAPRPVEELWDTRRGGSLRAEVVRTVDGTSQRFPSACRHTTQDGKGETPRCMLLVCRSPPAICMCASSSLTAPCPVTMRTTPR